MLKREKEDLIEEQRLLMRRGIGSGEKMSTGQHATGDRAIAVSQGNVGSAMGMEKSLNSTSNAAANQNAP